MSDGRLYFDEAAPEKTGSSRGFERVLKWSVLVLAGALAAEAVWFGVVVPCLPLRDIEVSGADGIPRAALLSAAGIADGCSFFALDPRASARGIETLPEVESASVTRRFPDGARIVVSMRAPVAVALAATPGGKTVPVSIDRNGVVFRVGGDAADERGGPIISGLYFENPHPGVRLPPFLVSLAADLARLRATNPALLDSLSEIRVVKKAYDAYELVLYPTFRPVRVRIGPRLNEDVLRYMMLLLDVLSSKGIDTDELDFRTGTASYRMKEG